MQYFELFLLLLSLVYFAFSENSDISNGTYRISILILSSPSEYQDILQSIKVKSNADPHRNLNFQASYLEIFGARYLKIGQHQLIPSYVDASEFIIKPNRLNLLESTLCSRLLNSSLATVIFSPNTVTLPSTFHSFVSSISYSIGFYKLPVLGVHVRDAEFSKTVGGSSHIQKIRHFICSAYLSELHKSHRFPFRSGLRISEFTSKAELQTG